MIMKQYIFGYKRYILHMMIAICLLFFNYSYCFGFVFGCLAYFINYLIIEYKYNNLLNYGKGIMNLFTLLGIFILFLSLLISFIIPSIFNYWFVFIGIVLNKYLLLFNEVRGVRE